MPAPIWDYKSKIAELQRKAQPYTPQTNSYLDTSAFGKLASEGRWEDAIRQLGLANLFNLTDFQSPLYQQFRKYLQMNTPVMGANTLLSQSIASGLGYAGGQNIANIKAQELMRQRQDNINQSVLNFALGNQNQVLNQIGQIGGSFAHQFDREAQLKASENQSTANMLQSIGQLVGTFAPMMLGLPPVGVASAAVGAAVGGFRR